MSDAHRDFKQARDAILHGTNNALPTPHHPNCKIIKWAELAREARSLGLTALEIPPPPLCTCGAATFGIGIEDE